MSILDKLPVSFIKEFVTRGGELSFEIDRYNVPYMNLNTGMKSHLHIYYEEDGFYYACTRYDSPVKLTYFFDLHDVIRRCECGKEFMNSAITTFYCDGFVETGKFS